VLLIPNNEKYNRLKNPCENKSDALTSYGGSIADKKQYIYIYYIMADV